MTKRLRLTGFARFLFVMVILVPSAYIGASYYNGEDGIANIKQLLGIESKDAHSISRTLKKETKPVVSNDEVNKLQQRIEELEQENRDLKVQIRDLENELTTSQIQSNKSKKGFQ